MPPQTNPEPVRPARRGARLAARAADLALIGYLFGVVIVEVRGRILGGDPFATRPLAGAQDPQDILLVLAAVIVVTDTIPTAVWGRTLGKAMMGIRSVRVDEQERSPGLVRSTLRTLVLFGAVLLPPVLAGPIVVVLVLSMFVDPGGRTLHDRLAGTRVVSAPRPEPAGDERPVPDGSIALPTPLPPHLPPHPDDI